MIKLLHRLLLRRWKSADQFWRVRAKWGEVNELFGHQIFRSDATGYKPPLLNNPFGESQKSRRYEEIEPNEYEYSKGQNAAFRKNWADDTFAVMHSMLEGRVSKDSLILDVGCATGYQGENFYRRGYTNLWGIDPQVTAIEYGKRHRPFLHLVQGYFGPPQNDIVCDVMVWFDSIFRIPYSVRLWDAIDRCTNKFVLITTQEVCKDLNRDPHVGLSKRGFICIEKKTLHEPDKNHFPPGGFREIDRNGFDGPLIQLDESGHGAGAKWLFRSFMLFRRVEPRSNPTGPVRNL